MFFQGFVGGYTTENCHAIVVASIDNAQGVKPVETGSGLAVFNVGEGRSGNFVIGTLAPVGDALAQGFHIAEG
jgi:hypothetical protein